MRQSTTTGIVPRTFRDNRRYSFRRTFGATAVRTDCDFDTGLSNFNQNLENPTTGEPAYPNGCTGFTRADIATNEDKIAYKPGYVYEKACLIAEVPVGAPVPIETSFKVGIDYGLMAVGETTEEQAQTHRRGPYFEVYPTMGQDYFDAIWSALLVGKKGISAGTPWFPEFNPASIVDEVAIRPTNDWHDWEAIGIVTTDRPRLKVKWWGGDPKFFGREAINALCSVQGTDLLTDVAGKARPEDIKTIRLNMLQLLTSYYYRLAKLLAK
jgi:hypothetical protein